MMRIARPGPGNGWRQTISPGRPRSFYQVKTGFSLLTVTRVLEDLVQAGLARRCWQKSEETGKYAYHWYPV